MRDFELGWICGFITGLVSLALAISMVGCGKIKTFTTVHTPIGPQYPVAYQIIPAPTAGGCYYLDPGLWAENEGDHIDVYNNDDCEHGPMPSESLCDNVYEGEVCTISNYLIYPEKGYSELKLHVLRLW